MENGEQPTLRFDMDMIALPDLMRLAVTVLNEIAERNEMSFRECVEDLLVAYDQQIESQ